MFSNSDGIDRRHDNFVETVCNDIEQAVE